LPSSSLQGLGSLILVPFFATKLAAGVVDTSGKLPPISTTLANLVAKFVACVIDTGGKFAAGVIDTGGNFATGVDDTGSNFATSVFDTGGAP
jgi:hypothetical protein